jgi:hypothetical protein
MTSQNNSKASTLSEKANKLLSILPGRNSWINAQKSDWAKRQRSRVRYRLMISGTIISVIVNMSNQTALEDRKSSDPKL